MNAVNGCGVWIASDSGKGETSDLQPPAPLHHGETRRGELCEVGHSRTISLIEGVRRPGGMFALFFPSGVKLGHPILNSNIETHRLPVSALMRQTRFRRSGMCECLKTPRTHFFIDPLRRPGGRFVRSDPSGFRRETGSSHWKVCFLRPLPAPASAMQPSALKDRSRLRPSRSKP